jgi:thiol:disulfide interchange protein
VEFTADWCLTCQTNKKTVLDTSFKRRLFREYGVVHLVGDLTVPDEAMSSFIRRYGRAGVPVYLLYRPGESQPVVFPEILNRNMLETELEE